MKNMTRTDRQGALADVTNRLHNPTTKVEAKSTQSPTRELSDLVDGEIKDFKLGKVIGSGAYAVVRQSVHCETNESFAIKSYEKSRLYEVHRRRNLRQEIEILRKLEHTNIIRYFRSIKSSRHVNIVMEYFRGQSLQALLKFRIKRRLSERETKVIFSQLASAVAYCHSKDIAHRDIKLDNVLVDSALNVKLIDFGFASEKAHTKSKVFCGTPSYMAPEIVSRKEFSALSADVWALGVLLWVLLVGSFPFRGSYDRELYRRIGAGVQRVPEVVPLEAKPLLRAMLSVDPEKRPTVEDVLKSSWLVGK